METGWKTILAIPKQELECWFACPWDINKVSGGMGAARLEHVVREHEIALCAASGENLGASRGRSYRSRPRRHARRVLDGVVPQESGLCGASVHTNLCRYAPFP